MTHDRSHENSSLDYEIVARAAWKGVRLLSASNFAFLWHPKTSNSFEMKIIRVRQLVIRVMQL